MECNVDKPIYISVGKDDMENIFLGSKSSSSDGNSSGDTSIISQYLTPQGLTRDCFVKLTEKLESVFGNADIGPTTIITITTTTFTITTTIIITAMTTTTTATIIINVIIIIRS